MRSTLPSPFTSAAQTDTGLLPTVSVALEPKTPYPLLVKTVSVLSKKLALIKSNF